MRRRSIVAGLGALVGSEASAATFPWLSPDLPDGTRSEGHLVQPQGKQPLIQLSDRPPNLETPIQSFRTAITPNDQFFVRYHLAGVPEAKDFINNWIGNPKVISAVMLAIAAITIKARSRTL